MFIIKIEAIPKLFLWKNVRNRNGPSRAVPNLPDPNDGTNIPLILNATAL